MTVPMVRALRPTHRCVTSRAWSARSPSTWAATTGTSTGRRTIRYRTTKAAALAVVSAVEWVISWTAASTRRSVEKFTTIPTAPTPTNQLGGAVVRRSEIFDVWRSPTVGLRTRDRIARPASSTPEAIRTTASVTDLCPWLGRTRARAVAHSREKAASTSADPATRAQARARRLVGLDRTMSWSASSVGLTAAPTARGNTAASRFPIGPTYPRAALPPATSYAGHPRDRRTTGRIPPGGGRIPPGGKGRGP